MALKNALGGIAFIAGTAVGAAVLALPVATAHLGFWLAATAYFIAWIFMTLGALYLLEVNLCVGMGANLISMAQKCLGSFGAIITWFIYLILLYALLCAYLTGAGSWIAAVFNLSFPMAGPIIIAVLTSILLLLGTQTSDWCNRLIMIGLIASYVLLIGKTSPQIDIQLLMAPAHQMEMTALPLIVTAFGFAIIVPSLVEYLHGNNKQLCLVILIGSVIPILMYLLWEAVIMGNIPVTGENGLLQIGLNDHPEIDLPKALDQRLQSTLITQAATGFSIFALLSSLIGVTLSIFDFLADGLKISKHWLQKLILCGFVFVPPLVILALFPKGFTQVLGFAGIFVAILLGILPAMMAWRVRYSLHLPAQSPWFGGKALLIITMLFFTAIITIEVWHISQKMLT